MDYVPWSEAEFKSKSTLRIGYIKSVDFTFKTCAAQRRAVEEAIELAKGCGHTLIEVDYDFSKYYGEFLAVLAHGDKAKELTDALQGEKIIDEYKLFVLRNKIPLFIIKLFGKIMNRDTTRFNVMMDNTAS